MKFKLPANILFSIASFFLLLHNVTPHLHQGEITESQNAVRGFSYNTIIDYLVLSLQHDHGEGHMECFSEASPIDHNSELSHFIKSDFIHALFLLNNQELENHVEIPLWLIVHKNIPTPLKLANPLRAPPTIV